MNKNTKILKGKYGKLTIVEYSHSTKRGAYWICDCDCGKKALIILGRTLVNGHCKSCGCLRQELMRIKRKGKEGLNKKEPGEASFNWLYSQVKANALRRNKKWNLTKKDFKSIVINDCTYCGCPPKQTMNPEKYLLNGDFVHNGIDRKDNSLGYTIENSVPCCKTCNYAKQDMLEQEFFEWIKKVYNYNSLEKK